MRNLATIIILFFVCGVSAQQKEIVGGDGINVKEIDGKIVISLDRPVIADEMRPGITTSIGQIISGGDAIAQYVPETTIDTGYFWQESNDFKITADTNTNKWMATKPSGNGIGLELKYFSGTLIESDFLKEFEVKIAQPDTIQRLLSYYECRYESPSEYELTQVLGSNSLTVKVEITQGEYYLFEGERVWIVGDEEQSVQVPKMLILGENALVLAKTADGIYKYIMTESLIKAEKD